MPPGALEARISKLKLVITDPVLLTHMPFDEVISPVELVVAW